MIVVKKEIDSIYDIHTWSGATSTVNTIIEVGKEEELFYLLETCFSDGVTETELNDFLWFETDFIFRELGIEEEEK